MGFSTEYGLAGDDLIAAGISTEFQPVSFCKIFYVHKEVRKAKLFGCVTDRLHL